MDWKGNPKTKRKSESTKGTTISDKKMGDKNSLILQVKSLEKNMVTVVKAIKDLKATVNALEAKSSKSENKEIQEIRENQKILDKAIKDNAEAIDKITDEIHNLQNDNSKANTAEEDMKEGEKRVKRCRYNNRGHCKYKTECKYIHYREVCKTYLDGRKCDQNACKKRHPKVCKWLAGKDGCRRNDCDYLHVTLASDDGQKEAHKCFPCAGCKSNFGDAWCVVQHIANGRTFSLCLNCDDWIVKKDMVINPGWTLFDQNGDLRADV